MRLAYADPPYPGQARKHYRDQPICAEVDHEYLIKYLTQFDGFALSTNPGALRDLLPLCPPDVRVGAWCKSFAAFKKAPPGADTACISPAYTWEPVIFRCARVHHVACRDHLVEPISMQAGLPGAKPPAFSRWIFDLLGAAEGDEFTDVFPGSGVVGLAWAARFDRSPQLELLAAGML